MIIFVQTLLFMEDFSLQTINIRRILTLAPVISEYALGSDFILGEVNGRQMEKSQVILDMLKYPLRFDGYIIIYLRKGHFKLDLNLGTYDITENTFLFIVPGNIVKLSRYSEEEIGDVDLIFSLFSRDFMGGIRLDFNKIYQDSIRVLKNPCIHLREDDKTLADDYFTIAKKVISSGRDNKREILSSLFASFSYFAIGIWTRKMALHREEDTRSSARVNQVFERFIALVTEYHSSQRGVGFYADKLCLTPKYLSKLVKQASGRSAPDWIDSFVILEAKNMLKYSERTIKEVVFALHFPNQSVFYKFFKAHTGLTPSQYRKG